MFFYTFQNVFILFYNNSPNACILTQNNEKLREKYAPRHSHHRKNGFPGKSLLKTCKVGSVLTELLWSQNRQNEGGVPECILLLDILPIDPRLGAL